MVHRILLTITVLLLAARFPFPAFGSAVRGDPMKGAPDGKVTITEYSDFQCPACAAMAPVLDRLVEIHPTNVRMVYKNFPLSRIHQWADTAARAGECAYDQDRFWEFHDLLFKNQDEWTGDPSARQQFLGFAEQLKMDRSVFDRCIDSESTRLMVEKDVSEGHLLNIHGTPTFFINGKRFVGKWKIEELEREVGDILSGHSK